MPSRLLSLGPRTVHGGVGRWTQVQRWPPSPRLLSDSCGDHGKHQEPPRKKLLSEKKLKRHFVDHRRVLVCGGRGGDGVSCFHSEPRKEFGGPDGGDGGNGGHVVLRADRQVKSLSSVLSRYQGFHGESGGRKNCFGRSGALLCVQVPVGTLVKEGKEVVADLSCPGDEYIAALGGAGGKGNRFFLANENRAPVTCTPGQPGQERVLFLELKTMAHAGMVGIFWRGEEVALLQQSKRKSGPGASTCLQPGRERQLGGTAPPREALCAHSGAYTLTCPCSLTSEVTRWVCLCSRLGSPMLGSPPFSGPFRTRDPLWLPTRSPL